MPVAVRWRIGHDINGPGRTPRAVLFVGHLSGALFNLPRLVNLRDMLKDAVKLEILSSRALAYRRSVIVLASMLMAVVILTDIDFSQRSFFGIKTTSFNQKLLVFKVLLALLTYHAIFFMYYAHRDLRFWLREALEEPSPNDGALTKLYFPEVRMFFGRPPKRLHPGLFPANQSEQWKYLLDEAGSAKWVPDIEREQFGFRGYRIPSNLKSAFREKYLWCVIIDCSLPLFMGLMAAVASLIR